MPVEDVFTIAGRGTVVTGRIERGVMKVNETVDIIGIHDTSRPPRSPASRCSASCSTRARPGENVGLLLRGIKREEVQRGMV